MTADTRPALLRSSARASVYALVFLLGAVSLVTLGAIARVTWNLLVLGWKLVP